MGSSHPSGKAPQLPTLPCSRSSPAGPGGSAGMAHTPGWLRVLQRCQASSRAQLRSLRAVGHGPTTLSV